MGEGGLELQRGESSLSFGGGVIPADKTRANSTPRLITRNINLQHLALWNISPPCAGDVTSLSEGYCNRNEFCACKDFPDTGGSAYCLAGRRTPFKACWDGDVVYLCDHFSPVVVGGRLTLSGSIELYDCVATQTKAEGNEFIINWNSAHAFKRFYERQGGVKSPLVGQFVVGLPHETHGIEFMRTIKHEYLHGTQKSHVYRRLHPSEAIALRRAVEGIRTT